MEVSIEYVVAGFIALGGAVGVLWRAQVVSQRHCIAENIRMGNKLDEFDRFQRDKLLKIAEENVRQNQTLIGLLGRAIRVIRRHESHAEGQGTNKERSDSDPETTPISGQPTQHGRGDGR